MLLPPLDESRRSRPLVFSTTASLLISQPKQPHQNLIAISREFLLRARLGLLMYAFNDGRTHVRSEFWRSEHMPPGRQWTGELIEEMLDTALTAAEVIQKTRPHDPPAQARAPRNSGVGIANATLFVTRGERDAVVYLRDGGRIRIQPPALDERKNLLGVGDAISVGVIDGIVRHNMQYADAATHAHVLVEEIARSDACNGFSLNALNSMVGVLYEDARNDKLTGLMRRAAFESEMDVSRVVQHTAGPSTAIGSRA
ncbi:hypothetical protein OKW42_003504 [Paraburkholderia sp. WC7.3d]